MKKRNAIFLIIIGLSKAIDKIISFKSIYPYLITFLFFSCIPQKQYTNQNIIPIQIEKYNDNKDAFYQVVQVYGSNKQVIPREAELTAKGLIISRLESKIKSINELRQSNNNYTSKIEYKSLTRAISEFKVLDIKLIDSLYEYSKKLNKYTFWGVYKIDSQKIQSILDKNSIIDIKFDDLIE